MTSRRGGRTTHVRPRPPSSGRPAQVSVRPRAPAPGRLTRHHPIDRGGRIPLPLRLVLAVGVIALGVGVLYVGAGGLSRVAGAVGSSFSGIVDDLTATPLPSATDVPVSDAPILESPEEPYTSTAEMDLMVTVPAALVGDDAHRIRVFQQLKDQSAVPIGEWPIGETQRLVVPVLLEKGINDFSAIIVGPGGSSEASPTVRYVLDTSKPKVRITSPKDNAKVNRKAVEIKGTTQGRATLIARNESNDASVSGVAAADGTFTLSLPIRPGPNDITITATDPAGNVRDAELRVRRGSGKLTVGLGASDHQFRRRSLPDPIRLVATVEDPDGNRLEGARVTFTLSVPGIAVITRNATTDEKGRASFETTISKSATVGQGLAAVLVKSDEFGTVDDRVVITIVK
jgi:glucodextranase-like protein